MPKTADEVFRDFVRFTGDGLPGAPAGHPLPVGDPSSGIHNLAKKDFRDWANHFEGDFSAVMADFEADIQQAQDQIDAAIGRVDRTDQTGFWAQNVSGLLADNIITIAPGTPDSVAVGDLLQTRAEGAAFEVVASGGDMVTAGGVHLRLIGPWGSEAFGGDSAAFSTAVRARAADLVARGEPLTVMSGESVSVPVNPETQDLQAYFNYMTLAHRVQHGGWLKLEIADGLHNVTTALDAGNGSRVLIEASGPAYEFDIANLVFSDQGIGVWHVRINCAAGSVIPAYVVPGYVVGVQNPVGNGTPDAAAQGMRVVTRHSDTGISCEFVPRGVTALSSMTAPTAGTALGLTQNRLIVPRCCVRANSAGWTAGGVGSVEGFINARNGTRIQISGVGLPYVGAVDGHEMLFAKDANSSIVIRDKTVVVGDCTILTRSAYGGAIHCEGAFLGLGTSGETLWQGAAAGSSFYAVRSMLGGGASEAFSATAGCEAFLTQSVLTGAATAMRPTYPDAAINVATCRIRHCGNVVQATRGEVFLDTGTSIEYCTTPFVVTGSASGRVIGNPNLANNTNEPITANAIQANGGVWINESGRPYVANNVYVGRFAGTLDFPSIPAGQSADLTISAAGVLTTDTCQITQSIRGSFMLAAACLTDGVITIRAMNPTSGAVDAAAFTALVSVWRNT